MACWENGRWENGLKCMDEKEFYFAIKMQKNECGNVYTKHLKVGHDCVEIGEIEYSVKLYSNAGINIPHNNDFRIKFNSRICVS